MVGINNGIQGERAEQARRGESIRQLETPDIVRAPSYNLLDEMRRILQRRRMIEGQDGEATLDGVQAPDRIVRENIPVMIPSYALQLDLIKPLLYNMGVLVDEYGFAWVAKPDHYFRVNCEDTQVYLFLRDEPETNCRVCIERDSTGIDVNKASGFNQKDLLLLSKIVALQWDLLPDYLAGQIRRFVSSKGKDWGVNIYDFDALVVFEREFKERYPQIYAERKQQQSSSPRTRPATDVPAGSLLAEMEAILARRRQQVAADLNNDIHP